MARYTGPTTKKARAFGEAIYGYDKAYEKRKFPPGQHGMMRKRKQRSDYAVQLNEKQKVKYTYGVLERQFRNLFEKAAAKSGVTGEILLQLLESRLDNVVYRMGIAKTRRSARQLVTHKHILVDGILTNIPSLLLKPGQVISVRGKSRNMDIIQSNIHSKKDVRAYGWIEFNSDKMEGRYIAHPEREKIPENINEQLIVELYSK
ncbi:MAG: 30S ribosomal protein S4 [Saprospiraceae bacterium]|nr:30S ribosomal protein S4 [Saprospiraceae bacterium]MBK8079916.1 30S ribosomal protein S4 [Saprospiraceae bacterium]MBK8370946.1 30S ribosomal protein S4 [Saprospiraceae bacterium]MBK8546246.1 30S ribosomal protein S4 [Saprospiraceae bacterium]MBK8818343.1 30S ribosomal protein S4 [Saprospiraceae bacterium]